ncbi:DHA2 family efflux MFS transporter permease subunit [Limosilactobacillus pontis]|uniref:DHA2 family efflux MFS transporter permease subunit n=1 Tax=Limosilactobacillus pontis TaxID=35787 RepID=A0ABT7UXF1_9LACO|nr:DHA2 family efflux MFS transporter permease subunit [Limosilactobacillus pontis]MDM8266395.1 DHA2 family efflux MFS transporter permease subunit [Limosilactobacillus pontis]
MSKNTVKIPARVIAAVIATGLLSFCGVIIETAMNVSFPKLMTEFGVTTNVVQWMTSIYLLVVAIIVPLSALLKRSFRTKPLFLTAVTFFILGVIIDALAPTFPVLLTGRLIQGLGTGISLPLMFNIIMEQVPRQRIGLMMGFGNLITGIAPAVGPTFGGIIVSSLGWRWIFYILLPFLLVSLLLGTWGIQQKTATARQHFDMLSCLLIAVMFIGLVVGFSNLATLPLLSWPVGGAILIGLVAMGLLSWRSLSITTPILDFRLFGNRRFAGHVLIFFLTQMCSLGFAFLLPNYIQLVNHNTALLAGLVVMPASFCGALFAPVGGRLLDQYGPKKLVLSGSILMAVAILIFTLFSPAMSNLAIALVYILYMSSMGSLMGTVTTSALASLPQDKQTQGNAILNTLQQFAGSMGTSLVAMIVAKSQVGVGKTAAATALGTQHAFVLLLVFVVMIVITALRFVPQRLK